MFRTRCVVISLLSLMLAGSIGAQVIMPLASEEKAMRDNGNRACGTTLLWEQEQKTAAHYAQHPELLVLPSLRKATAWNFVVGSQRSWFSVDFRTSPSQRYSVPSTCRAVGTKCYIFVEDAVWETRVTQSAVDAFKNAFDTATPANAAKGIYQTDVDTFGDTPDIDNDAKIIIFILDIKDRYTDTGSGGFISGFFSGNDQQPAFPQSNVAEILYIDANPLNLGSTSGLQNALATLAHEFQHMIHYRYDADEDTFINEGCSLVAEVHCGYPIYDQSGYITETNRYLLGFRLNDDPDVFRDYSRAARFMTFVRDQVGIGVFKPFVQNADNGTAGLDAALQTIGNSLRFNDIFRNWAIANALNDRTVNPAYGYLYAILGRIAGRLHGNPNVPLTNRTVQHLGVEYVSFKYGANLRATFTTANPALVIKAVEIGATTKRVLDVTPNIEFSEPAYGTTYQEVNFVIYNTNATTPFNYTYKASGVAKPAEVKWETSEPLGTLQLALSDTLCVTFDALAGGQLDSVRVALLSAGSITGGVWRDTGVLRPTPLETRLAFPIIASISTTATSPFPVPWKNWSKVDLRSFKISTDKPFVVGFIVGANAGVPGVMATLYPGDMAYHSFTYLNQPGSGASRNWYYLTDGQGSVIIYHIRAYVSFEGTTGVKETVELAPRAFLLAQNYPNPFNPSTTIEFSLPRASRVTLKVFSELGEEIATLLAGRREAGNHSVAWNANGLPSGIYFYRLEGEGFVETKKLVLMR